MRFQAVPLRIWLPLLVAGAFAIILLSLLAVLYFQGRSKVFENGRKFVTRDLGLLRREMEVDLSRFHPKQAWQALSARGVDTHYRHLIAINERGYILHATRLGLAGQPAQIINEFQIQKFNRLLEIEHPIVEVDYSQLIITAYLPLVLERREGELRPMRKGAVFAVYSLADQEGQILQDVVNSAWLMVVLTTLAMTAVIIFLHNYVTKPISHLAQTASQIGENEGAPVTPVTGSGELALLSRALQDMREKLRDRFLAQQKAAQVMASSQKMQAVGELTGGIAHDFNNILGAIIGNLELIRLENPPDELKEYLEEISKLSLRAADLTRQLLGFARKDSRALEVVDLAAVIKDMQGLIDRSITPAIQLSYKFSDTLWNVQVHVGDYQDTVLNLVINARDSMPGGGSLEIRLENHRQNSELTTAAGTIIPPGEYVVLSVTDTGHGMSEDVVRRIFEPFYTTKEKGKGTGLGLSMVYGFIARSAGLVNVQSVPGQGTTFLIYFPRALGRQNPAPGKNEVRELPEGDAKILVVDDELSVLKTTVQTLKTLGYSVSSCDNAQDALRLLETESRVDLLITDVLMPGMNGTDLAKKAVSLHPNMAVLFISGWVDNRTSLEMSEVFDGKLLNKPFTRSQLALKIHELLTKGERSGLSGNEPSTA